VEKSKAEGQKRPKILISGRKRGPGRGREMAGFYIMDLDFPFKYGMIITSS
jgi:hypothetical protein